MIMDNCGVYLPGAQMLLRNEDVESIKKGLITISNQIKLWKPRYFIVDDSAIEIRAVKEAFPGFFLPKDIFLCKVYSYRNIEKKSTIYNEKARQYLYQALSATTEAGCDQYIRLALAETRANENLYNYISKQWNIRRSAMWGTWRRSHSTLLLQNLTSNVVESYHSQLKQENKLNRNAGLKGVIVRVEQVAGEYERRRKSVASDFRSKKVSLVRTYKQIEFFPYPVQKRIAQQYEKAKKRYDNGKIPKTWLRKPACYCEFYMAYFLPCAYIFLCDMYFSLQEQLTGDVPSTSAENAAIVWKFGEDEWKDLYSDWEECGYETYFKWETFTAEISNDRIPVLNCDFKETSEIFQSIYYSIELNNKKWLS